MKVIDLTTEYLNCTRKGVGYSSYIRAAPFLFGHYLHFWGDETKEFYRLTHREIDSRKGFVNSALSRVEHCLDRSGIDHSRLTVILFVGQGYTNGHAFLHEDRTYAFIALESYQTQQYTSVFCAHEIAHALHYQNVPTLFFKNEEEMYDPLRQLLCEGVATYFSKRLLQLNDATALWADYLNSSQATDWLDECKLNEARIRRKVFNESSDSIKRLFQLNDLSDPCESRGGYWLGLKLVQAISESEDLSMRQILTLESDDMVTALRGTING